MTPRDPLIQPTGTGEYIRYRAARMAADCGADSSVDEWTSSNNSREFAAGFRILREAVATVGPDTRVAVLQNGVEHVARFAP